MLWLQLHCLLPKYHLFATDKVIQTILWRAEPDLWTCCRFALNPASLSLFLSGFAQHLSCHLFRLNIPLRHTQTQLIMTSASARLPGVSGDFDASAGLCWAPPNASVTEENLCDVFGAAGSPMSLPTLQAFKQWFINVSATLKLPFLHRTIFHFK